MTRKILAGIAMVLIIVFSPVIALGFFIYIGLGCCCMVIADAYSETLRLTYWLYKPRVREEQSNE